MASYQVLIAGYDYTTDIAEDGANLQTGKNTTPSSFSFIFHGDPYQGGERVVKGEADVELYIDGSKKFGGLITRIQKTERDNSRVFYQVECHDYTRLAAKGEPIAEIYKNTGAKAIMEDIITRYSLPFTLTNWEIEENIPYLYCDYLNLLQVIFELSEYTGADYYIDQDKDIHFYYPPSQTSVRTLDKYNGEWIHNSITIVEETLQIANMTIVKGAEFDSPETTSETLAGDGSQEVLMANKYANLTVTVDSVPQNVGIFGIHEQADYDVLYEYQAKKLIFTSFPQSGSVIVASGNRKLPVIAIVPDQQSINEHGILARKIKNNRIKTIDSANQFATRENERLAQELESGSFTTRKTHYRAGQKVTIEFLGEVHEYYIKQTTTSFKGGIATTNVSVASAEFVDAGIILAKLLRNDHDTENSDVLDVIRLFGELQQQLELVEVTEGENVYDTTQQSDTTDQAASNLGLVFVFGDYIPADENDTKKAAMHNEYFHDSLATIGDWYSAYSNDTLSINNGRLRITSSGYAGSLVTHPDIGGYEGSIQVTLHDVDGLPQIHFRQLDTSNFLLAWINGTSFKLSRVVGGSLTDITSTTVGGGEGRTIEVNFYGKTIHAVCRDTSGSIEGELTATDTWSSSSWTGVGLSVNSYGEFSDFYAGGQYLWRFL